MDMFSDVVNEENTRVSGKWKEENSKKKQDDTSAKVIDAVEASPEEVLAS